MQGFFIYSVLIATASCMLGIILPMQFEIPVPSGGAIILVATGFFALSVLVRASSAAFRGAGA
jgi:zinc transport system permease protein